MTVTALNRPADFFASARKSLFGGSLKQTQVDGVNELLTVMGEHNWPVSWAAYGFATAFHETAQTMQPIHERGSGDRNRNGVDDWFEKYDTGRLAAQLGNTPEADGDGETWKGRGYVQLTGRANYERADRELDLLGQLLSNPDLACRSDIAARILVYGMEDGWFTGVGCPRFLPGPRRLATTSQFINARRIINGQDAAGKIAGYAILFQNALQLGGWA